MYFTKFFKIESLLKFYEIGLNRDLTNENNFFFLEKGRKKNKKIVYKYFKNLKKKKSCFCC